MPYSTTSRTIELSCIVAGILWVAALGLFTAAGIVGAVTDDRHLTNMTIGASLIVAGVACCASVRVMLRNHYRAVRDAFEFGRDVGRSEVPLQRVR